MQGHSNRGVPHVLIEAIEEKVRPRKHGSCCVIGRNVIVDPQVLSAYCFRSITSRIADLVLLAGVVAFADKIVKRRHSVAWRREIDVTIPVCEPEFWQQKKLAHALHDTLGFLTGDTWHFTFSHRRQPLEVASQPTLSLGQSPVVVMPYSDGLDSFAAARLTSASQRGLALILVTTGRKKDADRDWRIDHLDGRRRRVPVPFRLSYKGVGHEFRESSFRSRAFVFGVMAGIAAHLSEALRVIIPESGQGTFGPWLLPVGNEAPDLHSHPLFSRRLAHFLNLAMGTRIRFEHPRRWHTKGETLLALAEQDLAPGWAGTHSRARRSYHVSLDGHRAHCGVCAACLLRRQSILKAGLNEADDRYVWRNLSADCLAAAAAPAVRDTSADDNRHAACGVLALAQLAELAGSRDFDRIVEHSAFELTQAAEESADAVRSKLSRVVRAHRDEWQTFVASQGPRSFISEWASAVAC